MILVSLYIYRFQVSLSLMSHDRHMWQLVPAASGVLSLVTPEEMEEVKLLNMVSSTKGCIVVSISWNRRSVSISFNTESTFIHFWNETITDVSFKISGILKQFYLYSRPVDKDDMVETRKVFDETFSPSLWKILCLCDMDYADCLNRYITVASHLNGLACLNIRMLNELAWL